MICCRRCCCLPAGDARRVVDAPGAVHVPRHRAVRLVPQPPSRHVRQRHGRHQFRAVPHRQRQRRLASQLHDGCGCCRRRRCFHQPLHCARGSSGSPPLSPSGAACRRRGVGAALCDVAQRPLDARQPAATVLQQPCAHAPRQRCVRSPGPLLLTSACICNAATSPSRGAATGLQARGSCSATRPPCTPHLTSRAHGGCPGCACDPLLHCWPAHPNDAACLAHACALAGRS